MSKNAKTEDTWTERTFRIWRPKPDDELIGVYVGNVTVDQGNAGPFLAHHVREKDTEDMYAVSGAVIDNALKDVPPGTQVRIVFLGQEELESGRRLNFFRVYTR